MHCLGIGSASQDRFLALLARETNGISRFVTPRERVDQAALELFASVARPVAGKLRITAAPQSGVVLSPAPPESVFQGSPLLVLGECATRDPVSLRVEFDARDGAGWCELAIGPADNACGETLRLLRGSRLITDAESRYTTAGEGGTAREAGRWESYLSRLSEEYSLACRSAALVAVIERAGDRPGEPPMTRVVPLGLPQDVRFEGIFGTRAAPGAPKAARYFSISMAQAASSFSLEGDSDEMLGMTGGQDLVYETFREEEVTECALPTTVEPPGFDLLMDLSARVESDGGMPGAEARERILATLLMLLAFLEHGHSLHSGPFRIHVGRLLGFLQASLPGALSSEEQEVAHAVLAAVTNERSVRGEWPQLTDEVVKGMKGAAERAWRSLRSLIA
jgi:hypothetical protein